MTPNTASTSAAADKGLRMARDGQVFEAIRYLQGLAQAPGGTVPAKLAIARICMATGDLGEAGKQIEEAAELAPQGSADILVARAQVHVAQRDFGAALPLLEQARHAQPDLALLYPALADCLRETGRIDDSVEAARKGVELSPQSSSARYSLTLALGAAHKFDESIIEGVETFLRDPHHIPVFLYLGALERFAGQLELAIRLLEDGVRWNPDALPLHQLLVDLHLENGNAAEALPHAVAVSLLDWTPQTVEVVAECARLTGNLGLAERAFLAAIERRQAQGVPHWGPHYLLGNLYLEHNAFDRAEVELRRAVELNAAAWQPLYSLASVLLETGRPSEAERVLANANTLAPAEPQPALRLARLFQGSGRTTEAMILAYKAFENTAPEGGRGTPQLREEALSLLRILSEKTQPSRPN